MNMLTDRGLGTSKPNQIVRDMPEYTQAYVPQLAMPAWQCDLGWQTLQCQSELDVEGEVQDQNLFKELSFGGELQ